MSIIYHVKTSNYLPKTKKFFKCRCNALDYIKNLLDKCEDNLDKTQMRTSIVLLAINENKLPDYKKLFPKLIVE